MPNNTRTGNSNNRLPPPRWDLTNVAWTSPVVFSDEQRRDIGNIFGIEEERLDEVVSGLADCCKKALSLEAMSKNLPTPKELESAARAIHEATTTLHSHLQSVEIGGIRSDLMESLMFDQDIARPDLFLTELSEKLATLQLAAEIVSKGKFHKLLQGSDQTRFRRYLAFFIGKLMRDSLKIQPTVAVDEDGDPPKHGKWARTFLACQEAAGRQRSSDPKGDLKMAHAALANE